MTQSMDPETEAAFHLVAQKLQLICDRVSLHEEALRSSGEAILRTATILGNVGADHQLRIEGLADVMRDFIEIQKQTSALNDSAGEGWKQSTDVDGVGIASRIAALESRLESTQRCLNEVLEILREDGGQL